MRRNVESSVAKSWSAAKVSAPVRAVTWESAVTVQVLVEQGRLAAVGIADQRQHRNLATAPGAPPLGTALAHRFEPLLHPLRALPQHPLVELELGLTGTAQTNAAFLPVEVTPAAHQPAGEVLQLRQLDLQLPLMGAGAQRENDQDQPGAVEHPQSEPAFEVALLR